MFKGYICAAARVSDARPQRHLPARQVATHPAAPQHDSPPRLLLVRPVSFSDDFFWGASLSFRAACHNALPRPSSFRLPSFNALLHHAPASCSSRRAAELKRHAALLNVRFILHRPTSYHYRASYQRPLSPYIVLYRAQTHILPLHLQHSIVAPRPPSTKVLPLPSAFFSSSAFLCNPSHLASILPSCLTLCSVLHRPSNALMHPAFPFSLQTSGSLQLTTPLITTPPPQLHKLGFSLQL